MHRVKKTSAYYNLKHKNKSKSRRMQEKRTCDKLVEELDLKVEVEGLKCTGTLGENLKFLGC